MFNRLKKLKKLWELSSKSEEELKDLIGIAPESIPDKPGEATFFSEGTDEEYQTYLKEETQGWKGFYEKLRGLL